MTRDIPLPVRLFRICLFVGLAFLVVRNLILEPFGVPTGSMAGTLLGNHREMPCPRCGHPVVVGEQIGAERRNPYAHGHCPNCGRRDLDLRNEPDITGDRLIVDKVVYSVRAPRRWELAVFRCPVDDATPYVKRVVGLPNEAVQILGGDIFIDGEIVRKSWAEFQTLRVPVFDSRFEPAEGWAKRWVVSPGTTVQGLPRLRQPLADRPIAEGQWQGETLFLNSETAETVRNEHRNLDNARDDVFRDSLPYNAGTGVGSSETVHDFLVVFQLVRHQGTFSFQVTDGQTPVEFQITDSQITIDRGGGSPALELKRSLPAVCMIEAGIIDRTVHLVIDGQPAMEPIALPADPTTHGRRPPVSSPVRFTIRNGSAEVKQFRIERDVHYRKDGLHGIDAPYKLGPNEFFMLGDNSANSRDSRVWATPAVPRGDFLGKPVVIHQAMRANRVTLNGQDRSYPVLDWQRLRWLR